jgi:NADH dehydrogenase
LTFVIVGAGPTGVEMAGTTHELAAHSLAKDFKNISLQKANTITIKV